MGSDWCKPDLQILQEDEDVLETEDILYEACDLGLLRPEMISFYMASKSNFPQNWYRYNPNLYLEPSRQLSKRDTVFFFLALMEYHTPVGRKETQHDKCMRELVYYPNVGIGYRSMLNAAITKNINHI